MFTDQVVASVYRAPTKHFQCQTWLSCDEMIGVPANYEQCSPYVQGLPYTPCYVVSSLAYH